MKLSMLVALLSISACSTPITKTVLPPKHRFELLLPAPTLKANIVPQGEQKINHVVIPLDTYKLFIRVLKARTRFYETQIKQYLKEE